MIGVSVGPYQIVGKLGAGGMGEVFLGHDPRLQRRVALKCLTRSDHQPSEVHARIMREARAAARLTHPNIAAVYDVLEDDGRMFIVMEYVEGESLAALLARERLTMDRVGSIGGQLASALAAAHAQGVVHRDLKPANIQVTRDGSIKVLDFGIAKLSSALATSTGAATGAAAIEQTLPGNPGTPMYMSPEQLLEKAVDARSDLYSAGVILFEMATGRRPYQEKTAIALGLAMSKVGAPRARSINPQVTEDLNETIARALEREPGTRWQSARDLERALAVSDPVAAAHRRSRSGPRALIVLAATLAVVLAWPNGRETMLTALGLRAASTSSSIVIAVLPIDNPTGNPNTGQLGSLMTTAVASNFRSVAGVRVLPRASAVGFANRRTDGAAMQHDFGATHVLDLTIKGAAPMVEVTARLHRIGATAPEWRQTIVGAPAHIEAELLAGIGRALSGGFWRRTLVLGPEQWAAIGRLPTRSDTALTSYAEASVLLERSDLPANVQRAIDRLQNAVDADPAFALGYATLGATLVGRYERTKEGELVDRAGAAIATALKLDADLSAAHYASGYLQYVTGQREAAVRSLQRAIALDPDDDAAHRLLGWRLFATQGLMDDAVSELRKAIAIRPDSFDNNYRFGTVLYLAGRYAEAVDAYRHATELQPMRADAYTNLGVAYHLLGDVRQALGNYEHAINLGAGNALAYGNLAFAYYFTGRYEDALKASLEAIAREPNRPSRQSDLGDYYEMLGKTNEARAAYTRALALARKSIAVNPRDAASIVLVALCEAHLGARAEAERHVAEALALAPRDRDIFFRGAMTYVFLGDRRAAMEALRTAVQHGYAAPLVRGDPQFASLKSDRGFEEAIAAGLRVRSPNGAGQQ